MPLKRRQRGFTRIGGFYTDKGNAFARTSKTELKFLDVNQPKVVPQPTGTILKDTLFILPQGTGISERIGRNVVVTKIMFQGNLHLAAGAGATDENDIAHDLIRIIVYWDKQCNGGPATPSDILNGNPPNYNAFRNLANTNRFVILADKRVMLNSTSMINDNNVDVDASEIRFMTKIKNFQYFLNVNIPIEYGDITGGTEGDISEIRSNNVGVLAITKDGIIDITGTYRIRYKE